MGFMQYNEALETLYLPSLEKANLDFVNKNQNISNIYLPKLTNSPKEVLEGVNKIYNLCIPNNKNLKHLEEIYKNTLKNNFTNDYSSISVNNSLEK